MATRAGKTVFVVAATVIGLSASLLASGYLVHRGQPHGLAGAVGALVFPVLPVAWHVFGERRRRQRRAAQEAPAKALLSAGDRYVLRSAAVLLVVLGPMFYVDQLDVVRGAWRHRTWFLPAPTAAEVQHELLAHLPSDAEFVAVGQVDLDRSEDRVALALGKDQVALIASAGSKYLTKLPGDLGPVAQIELADNLVAAVTEDWKAAVAAGGGPNADLRAELSRAPGDAQIVAGFATASPNASGIKRGSAWLSGDDVNKRLVLRARFEATDDRAAERAIAMAKEAWSSRRVEVPATCRDVIGGIIDHGAIERAGAVVTVEVAVEQEQLVKLLACGLD